MSGRQVVPVPQLADVIKNAHRRYEEERRAIRENLIVKKLYEIDAAKELVRLKELEYDVLINGMIK
jgi:hypothetical protein